MIQCCWDNCQFGWQKFQEIGKNLNLITFCIVSGWPQLVKIWIQFLPHSHPRHFHHIHHVKNMSLCIFNDTHMKNRNLKCFIFLFNNKKRKPLELLFLLVHQTMIKDDYVDDVDEHDYAFIIHLALTHQWHQPV